MHSESERRIFRFNEGSRKRAVDPLSTYRKLISFPGLNLAADIRAVEMLSKMDLTEAPDPINLQIEADGMTSFNRVIAAARHAFGVTDFNEDDESGLTDEEVMDVFRDFMEFFLVVKKNTNTLPTSLKSTGLTSSNGAKRRRPTKSS